MSSGECVAENVIDADHQVAVLVPCYNKERAVAKVVADFPAALPASAVYVYDNNSTDKTSWRDGYRILWTVLKLYRAERPLSLFGAFGIALAIVSIGLAIPISITYVQEGLVPRFSTAILSSGPMLLAFLFIAVGLILDTVTRGRRELKLLACLALRAPGEERRRS
jgi:hypothetical protein